MNSLYLQFHTCSIAQRKLPGHSRAPQRLTLPATLCALSPDIAVHPVLPQRFCMLSFRYFNAPGILYLLALPQKFRFLLLQSRDNVWRRVTCFQYSIHGGTVVTCVLLATWDLGKWGKKNRALQHVSFDFLIFGIGKSGLSIYLSVWVNPLATQWMNSSSYHRNSY